VSGKSLAREGGTQAFDVLRRRKEEEGEDTHGHMHPSVGSNSLGLADEKGKYGAREEAKAKKRSSQVTPDARGEQGGTLPNSQEIKQERGERGIISLSYTHENPGREGIQRSSLQ